MKKSLDTIKVRSSKATAAEHSSDPPCGFLLLTAVIIIQQVSQDVRVTIRTKKEQVAFAPEDTTVERTGNNAMRECENCETKTRASQRAVEERTSSVHERAHPMMEDRIESPSWLRPKDAKSCRDRAHCFEQAKDKEEACFGIRAAGEPAVAHCMLETRDVRGGDFEKIQKGRYE
jgi:hypothetical protein